MVKGSAQMKSGAGRIMLRHHLSFTMISALILLLMYTALRAALLVYNIDLAVNVPKSAFLESFRNGARFDLRLIVYGCAPLVFATVSRRAMAARRFHVLWLAGFSSVTLFLGLIELDFYREFHQRLNGLVFQYISEDPKTVLSMLWYGFPVLRYLLAWALVSWGLFLLFRWVDRKARPSLDERAAPSAAAGTPLYLRLAVFGVVFLAAAVTARGTLQQGPPLRWGAAFTTESLFANHLGLNATLSLANAAMNRFSENRSNVWVATRPEDEAQDRVREMLLTPQDTLVDADTAAVRRIMSPSPEGALPIKHVIVILMESFAGRYVGALGGEGNITPYFDALSKEGLLFTRYFSNGTHTHQGMFATMACFPNLPGFEYLMQQPEGAHQFSGLPQLLSAKGFDDLYVYNGAFSWDNQSGFFSNQGMRHFIGRNDFIDPVFSDPTWGVSDQDMFDRAAKELQEHYGDKPFYALLQTLSNHTPYALPEQLPVERVTGFGYLDEHLTAMRYSDWALGQFFEKARKLPYFNETLFVILGDHGFGSPEQLTDIDLYRFHVPVLMIAPGIQETFGTRSDIVGTQVDIVPTIMGRLGMKTQHQCWGRDLLSLTDDSGFGVVKPSGSDQTVAMIDGDQVLVLPRDQQPILYDYRLHENPGVDKQDDAGRVSLLRERLESFIQVTTKSLLENTAGVGDVAPE